MKTSCVEPGQMPILWPLRSLIVFMSDPALAIKYTETVLPNGGFVTDDKNASTAMSGVRVATNFRELARISPTLLLKANDNAKEVRNIGNQRISRQSSRAVSFNDNGTNFIIALDNRTHLPVAIRTLDDDNVHGDASFDAVLGDWKAVATENLHFHQQIVDLVGSDRISDFFRSLAAELRLAFARVDRLGFSHLADDGRK